MSKTPTYNNIKNLAIKLQQETKVKARRDVGLELLSAVSKDDVRKKLASEASPQRASSRTDELSVAAQRCQALSQLWVIIIQGSIKAAETIRLGGKKLYAEDITLPFRLLVQCDKPDEAFDGTGLGIPKLSRKTIRATLNYCLAILDDESAVNLAEAEMLEMLNYICSRVEYVANFKHGTDLTNILSELGKRLESSVLETQIHSVFLHAARAFDNLITSCKTLGIEMHDFLPDIIVLVSDWCKAKTKSENDKSCNSDILTHFFNAITSLLECHPEHSIGLMRRHGRALLSYVKRCYKMAHGVQKTALNNYLLAHM
jgi:hypothetical protein